jgi:hypothetical protein
MPAVTTTVLLASDSFALTTVANVRSDLGETDISLTDDFLSRLVAQCSKAAERRIGRVLALQGYRDTIKTCPYESSFTFDCLRTSRFPLISVSKVTVDGTDLTADTDFELDVPQSRLWRLDSSANRIAWCASSIVVEYLAGYALPEQTEPAEEDGGGVNTLEDNAADLEDAVIRMVKARLLARDRDPYLRAEEVVGVASAQYWVATGDESGNLPPDVAEILDSYRVPTFV